MSQLAKLTICPLCSLGCGLLIEARGADVQVAGDPAHPINRGALCARGAMLARSRTSPLRATAVRYRPAGARSWEPRSWDWALDRIAGWLAAGQALPDRQRPLVLGGTALDCEDILALTRLAAAWNLPHGLGAASGSAAADAVQRTYGVPTFDFTPNDFLRSRTIIVWGANPAEGHPIAMRWFLAAQDRLARLVVVDPRMTRTAAAADLHLPLCPGTDLALIEALLAEAISRGAVDRDFLAARSDAAQRLHEQSESAGASAQRSAAPTSGGTESLDDPRSVWRRLVTGIRRSPAVGSPAEFAQQHCGIAKDRFAALCDAIFADNRQPVAIVVGNGLAQQRLGLEATRALAVLHAFGGHAAKPGGGMHVFGTDANVRGAWRMVADAADDARPRAMDIAGREGAMICGENPAVCTAATSRLFDALDRLRWCVVADLWENETAAYWRRPGVDSANISTEVLLLPLPHPLECDGTSINTAGTTQRRKAVLPPLGNARAVRDFVSRLTEACSPHQKGDNRAEPPSAQTAHPLPPLQSGPTPSNAIGADLPPSPAPQRSPTVSFRSRDGNEPWLPLWSVLAVEDRTSLVEQPPSLPTDRPVVSVLAGVVRLGEHALQSVFTRAMPWLVEMAPGPFVELGSNVAAQLGVRQGEMVRVVSANGAIDLPAMVTRRLPAFHLGKQTIEQIAVIGLFGHCGLAIGPTGSSLAPPPHPSQQYEIQKAFAAWVCRSDVRRPLNPLQ